MWALKVFLYKFCLASLLRQEGHDSAISKISLLIPAWKRLCLKVSFFDVDSEWYSATWQLDLA